MLLNLEGQTAALAQRGTVLVTPTSALLPAGTVYSQRLDVGISDRGASGAVNSDSQIAHKILLKLR